MKTLRAILVFVLLISANLIAQDSFSSIVNSTTTALGSSATFTGGAERIEGYGSVVVTYKSDKASAVHGVKFQFSSNGNNWDSYLIKTYTAGDSLTNTTILPIKGKYFRVVYTNTNSAQTYFRLQTIFSKNVMLNEFSLKNSSGTELFTSSNPALVSNIAGWRDTTFTFTIQSGASLSDSINIGNRRVKLIEVPATWTTANLTFVVYASSAWQPLIADDAELVMTATQATTLVVNPRYFIGASKLKFRSGTSASAVNQGGTRTIKVVCGNY